MPRLPRRFRRGAARACVLLCIGYSLPAQEAPYLLGLTADGQVWNLEAASGAGEQRAQLARGWEYACLASMANGTTWLARQRVQRSASTPFFAYDPEFLRLGPDGENEPRWRLAEGELPTGMAFDREGLCLGILPTTPATLVHYDFARELVTPLGNLATTDVVDLAWSDGHWYLWSNGSGLAELDPTTLALRPIGPAPEPGAYDLRALCELPGGRIVAAHTALYDIDVFGGNVQLRAEGQWPPFVGLDRSGMDCWFPYGHACAGNGNFLPRLSLGGCAAGGGSLQVIVDRGPGGALAAVLVGFGELEFQLTTACGFYLLAPSPFVLSGFLGGENPGEGEISFALPLAHGMRGFANVQAFIIDPLAVDGFTSTNAVSLRIPF